MAHFLAVSAVRTDDEAAVADFIIGYCSSYGLGCKRVKVEGRLDAFVFGDDDTDALVFASDDGWVRVLWPTHFTCHDFPLCQEMAAALQAAVSTIHVYHGEFWGHLFVDGEKVLHKFSSWPDYFAESATEAQQLKEKWRGDPSELAEFFGIPPDSISGYMLQYPFGAFEPEPVTLPEPPKKKSFFSWLWSSELWGPEPDPGPPPPPPGPPVEPVKAYPTDETTLEDFWVFMDFWAKLGIRYPDIPDEKPSVILRITGDFMAKLPASD